MRPHNTAALSCASAGRATLDTLTERFAVVPALRAARERVARRDLLSANELAGLAAEVERQAASAIANQFARQERRVRYRDQAARDEAGAAGRLLGRAARIATRFDEAMLGICPQCAEIAYPDVDRIPISAATQCDSCGGSPLRWSGESRGR